MESAEAILGRVRAALEDQAGIDPELTPIELSFDGSLLRLGGSLPSITTKKKAVDAVSHVAGVCGVIDGLRVGAENGDGHGALRDTVCELLLDDVDFRNCTIRALRKGRHETLREVTEESSGSITVAVDDGVVTLVGDVISLTHKRLAGVMAWWAHGCRDVVNALVVTPPEEDTDDEVTDALRLVLETDRRVHASQIGIRTRNHVVTLEGVVPSESERDIVEQDAWCLYAVHRVVNRIEVRP